MTPEVSTVSGDQSVEELKRELAEAREQQAAIAEILAAISSSPIDPNRVFARDTGKRGAPLRCAQRGDFSARR